MNFKNFFFVSFDPSGFVTIDKSPISFWLQAISAKIFEFSGFSIILPQALSGVISVFLIYYIVKSSFGSSKGLICALCLATTPIFVAASRNNTIDNDLVLCLLLSVLFIIKSIKNNSLKYLIISFAFIGLGFNVKMSEAYLILPALYLSYFLSSSLTLRKKIINLSCATLVLVVVSLSWALAVDAVPAKDSPFVWSCSPVFLNMNSSSPSAGLELSRNSHPFKNKALANPNSKLAMYLKKSQTHEKYLVSVPSATTYASSLILETGKPVMTFGGFSGNDNIISLNNYY